MGVHVQGQLTLPTNPNGLVFSAPADAVLARRHWADVLSLAAAPLRHFHAVSGLSAAAWMGGRAGSQPEVTLLFVFDGPATAADLRALQDAARAGPVSWGEGTIERIPRRAVPCLMAHERRIHQLWRLRAGGPVVQQLVRAEGEVRVREVAAAAAGDGDALADAAQVELRFPELSDVDAELERMRVAFARHFALRIVEADGIVAEDEAIFMQAVFPEELMARLGLSEAVDRASWLSEATQRLPTALGHHDKLAMLGLFFSACYCDGSLDAREVRVLREAGEVLGLGRPEIVSYLSRFW